MKPSVEVLEHHSGGVGTWLAQLKKQTTEKSGPTKSMSALYLLPHFGAITSLGNRNILIFWLRKWRFGRAAYSTQRRDSGRFIGGLGDSRVPSKKAPKAILSNVLLITRSALDGVCLWIC